MALRWGPMGRLCLDIQRFLSCQFERVRSFGEGQLTWEGLDLLGEMDHLGMDARDTFREQEPGSCCALFLAWSHSTRAQLPAQVDMEKKQGGHIEQTKDFEEELPVGSQAAPCRSVT